MRYQRMPIVLKRQIKFSNNAIKKLNQQKLIDFFKKYPNEWFSTHDINNKVFEGQLRYQTLTNYLLGLLTILKRKKSSNKYYYIYESR